jgi:hypothetical protein
VPLRVSGMSLTVMFDVSFGRFRTVLHCVLVMTVCQVRMVRRGLVSAFFVVHCGFLVVPSGVFVMLCCLMMMIRYML